MRSLWVRVVALAIGICAVKPEILFASGGGMPVNMVIVADSRDLTGIMAWLANMYNESYLQFTLLTIIVVHLIGLCLGILSENDHDHENDHSVNWPI